MGLPTWALVVLVVYPLAQVPLVFYLARWFELDGEAPAPTPGQGVWTEEAAAKGATDPVPTEPGRCDRCGTANDPGYTFCGACLARL